MPISTAQWKFVLANSADLSHIGELNQARNKNLSVALNNAGSCSFTMPMRDEYAAYVNPYSSAVKCYRWSPTTGLWNLVWSGYVLTVEEDIVNEHMNVSCVGWLQRLEKRWIRRDRNYAYAAGVSTDDADIIYALLAEVNGTTTEFGAGTTSFSAVDGVTIRWPSGSSPNVPTWIKQGSKLPNQGVGGATAYVAAYRGKNYQKYQNVLQAVQELTQIENGCDIDITPDTRLLNVYRRKQRDRTNNVFALGWGPNNLSQFGRQIDGSVVVNHHLSTGKAGAPPQYAEDATSQGQYGTLEEQMNLSDVADRTVLLAYSGGEVVLRAQPRQIFSMTPFPFTLGSSVPEPFEDYTVGDLVALRAVLPPRVNVQNAAGTGPLSVRVFGISVAIDDDGQERLGQLQVSP